MKQPTLTIKSWTGSSGEYFTYSDMNRVESNINAIATAVIAEQTSSKNGKASVSTVSYVTTTRSSQFRYDEAQKLENQIQTVADVVGASYSKEASWSYNRTVSYVDYNRWEQGISAIRTAMASYWPVGTLSVSVTDAYGTAYSGRTVMVLSGSTVVATLTTSSSGAATCKLNNGTYTVKIDTPSGYASVSSKSVTITGNSTSTVAFALIMQVNITFAGYQLNKMTYTIKSGTTTVSSGSGTWASSRTFTLKAKTSYTLTITAYGDSQSYTFTTGTSAATHTITSLFCKVTATTATGTYSLKSIQYNGYTPTSSTGTSVSWYVLRANASRRVTASLSTTVADQVYYSGVIATPARYTEYALKSSYVAIAPNTTSVSAVFSVTATTVKPWQVVTESGSLTVPVAGSYRVLVIGGGGGGGGPSWRSAYAMGGGGGGGSGYVTDKTVTLAASTAYKITIGAGGAGGTRSNDNDDYDTCKGTTGGTTTMVAGTTLSAAGGAGGGCWLGGSTPEGGAGGAGGGGGAGGNSSWTVSGGAVGGAGSYGGGGGSSIYMNTSAAGTYGGAGGRGGYFISGYPIGGTGTAWWDPHQMGGSSYTTVDAYNASSMSARDGSAGLSNGAFAAGAGGACGKAYIYQKDSHYESGVYYTSDGEAYGMGGGGGGGPGADGGKGGKLNYNDNMDNHISYVGAGGGGGGINGGKGGDGGEGYTFANSTEYADDDTVKQGGGGYGGLGYGAGGGGSGRYEFCGGGGGGGYGSASVASPGTYNAGGAGADGCVAIQMQ